MFHLFRSRLRANRRDAIMGRALLKNWANFFDGEFLFG